MTLTEDNNLAPFQIKAYSPGFITINDIIYTHSLIISPNHLIADWRPQSLAMLEARDLAMLISSEPKIILFGTGKSFKMPTPLQLAPLYQAKLSVECMDTGAACRTFVALSSEGRDVIAALLIE